MELGELKQFLRQLVRHNLELVLISAIVLAAYLIQSLVPHKLVAMNFFFLPVVVAAYCLGTRAGGLTALFSFLIIVIYAIASPQRFLFQATPELLVFDLLIWGSFLGLTSLAVGSLSDQRRRQTHELRSAYVGILEVLAKFLESADHYTKSHSVRVAELSTAIATAMGLGDEEINTVRAGALLHDIGKTAVSLELVKRASALSESERRQVATHTATGAALIQSLGSILKDAVPIILYHHHYYGGREGQEGPIGDQIPLGARIVAMADAYDAIVTDRPYRKGRAPWQAVLEIEACAGTQFDPEVIKAFKQVLPGDSIEPERELLELCADRAEIPPPENGSARRDAVRSDTSSV